MNGKDDEGCAEEFVFDYQLDAAPEKVWRALSLGEFRNKWLPDGGLADPEPVSSAPGHEITYRMRDDAPPFFESVVTFQIRPGADDGTLLRIVHRLTDARLQPGIGRVANDNGPVLMRAA